MPPRRKPPRGPASARIAANLDRTVIFVTPMGEELPPQKIQVNVKLGARVAESEETLSTLTTVAIHGAADLDIKKDYTFAIGNDQYTVISVNPIDRESGITAFAERQE